MNFSFKTFLIATAIASSYSSSYGSIFANAETFTSTHSSTTATFVNGGANNDIMEQEQQEQQRHRHLSEADEARAYMPVPPHGSPLSSKGVFDSVPTILNNWLIKIHPNDKLKPCNEFEGVEELNGLLKNILERKHPKLQEIYTRNCNRDENPKECDNRHLDWDTVEEHEEFWKAEHEDLATYQGDGIGELMYEVATHGKCFKAVMMFHHHLSADDRKSLLERDDFVLPLLPESYESLDSWAELLKASGEGNDSDNTNDVNDGNARRLYRGFSHPSYVHPKDGTGPANCGGCH